MAKVRIPEQKVILCGEYGVGKSSLFRRFTNNSFITETDRKSTLGLDHIDREYTVQDKAIKLQLWDTGGMERVASVTSSYYKFAEGAILVFALDNASSFHSMSQHLLDIVTYAENAKIFICGNKSDLEGREPQVSDAEMEAFCEQCHSLISATYKTSCKTGEGVEEMFRDISNILVEANRSKMELQALEQHGFKIDNVDDPPEVRAAMARRSSTGAGAGGDNGNTDDLDDLDSPSTDGIEAGSLAIKDSERTKEKDLWQRPTTQRMLPSDGTTVLRFEIPYARIMPPQNENLNVKRYVVYDLSVRQDSSVIDPNPATIERRYTDFLILFTNLRKDQPVAMSTVYFPKKVIMGNFSNDLIAERSAAFEVFLDHVVSKAVLRDSPHFLHFLQNIELKKACQLLDERRNESAIPLLENLFRLLNKIFMDRSKPVLLILCRLVAACTTSPVPHPSADRWAELALRRYETLCDTDLLPLYIPLLHTCAHLWWQRGRDQKLITDRLTDMSKKGININNSLPLMKAIHLLDPRAETI